MSGRADRLARLASAQAELAGFLEAKLACEDVRAHELRGQIDQLAASMEGADGALLIFKSAALKRLAEAGAALISCQAEADAVRRKLLAARGREKALSAKAILFRMTEERKAREEEGLETALHMATKACRKTGML